MRSLCLFAAYFTGTELPYYIRVYLAELRRHFTEVILLMPEQGLSPGSSEFLSSLNIEWRAERNEGFDFGLWYKAFQRQDMSVYDQVALVNDSCILFRPLDDFMAWSRAVPADLQGMTYSEAIAPHIQSFFLLINKKAIPVVSEVFVRHGVIKEIAQVIRTYEVGLTTELLARGYTIAAYMNRQGAEGEFSPYYTQVKDHLEQGIPLIKKKILFASYRKDELFTLARMDFDIRAEVYIDLIRRQHTDLILSFEKLAAADPHRMPLLNRLKFYLMRGAVRLYRRIKYGR
jgi:lipopolysaccharide biosynthesis protein